MSFDPATLLASLIVSSIGFVLFKYGRSQRRLPHSAVGLAMLIYPYFVPDVTLMLVLAPVLLALLWGAVKLGM